MARRRTTARPQSVSPATARKQGAARRRQAAEQPSLLTHPRAHHVVLGGLLLIAAFMNLFRLNTDAYPSYYYAAGVQSMLTSLHNFFFVSLDQQGFVSIDKPPLGFWVQTLVAKVFGLSPLSVVLPQVLAGVAAVGVLFHLVRRTFGLPAAALAGLTLALSPVVVATNRTNLIDPQVMLTSLLAAWAIIKAIEEEGQRRRILWLLLGATAIAAGFNIKSAQALLPAPALFLTYFLAARDTWLRKVLHCALAGALLVALGLVWPLVYDSVPAAERPWVGSSTTNSQFDLIFRYNAANRFQNEPSIRTGPSRAQGFGWFYGLMSGGQIGWLVPLATFGAVAAWRGRPTLPLGRQHANLVLWVSWVLPQYVFFSLAEFVHNYYLVMLAPAVSALGGIGAVALYARFREGGWRAWLAPAAIVATVLINYQVLGYIEGWRGQLLPVVLLLALPALAAQLYLLVRRNTTSDLALAAGAAALLAAMVAPTVWAALPVRDGVATAFPAGGPRSALTVDDDPQPLRDPAAQTFLAANMGSARWAVATRIADDAADFMIATGLPAMALGGYIGNDPILTPEQFQAKLANGEVRYVLVNPRIDLELPRSNIAREMSLPMLTLRWATEHCALVPWEAWRSKPATPANQEKGWSRQLYDCANPTP
ncbi:MAG: hypothetical protein DCC58_11265 [Chloroflexi bacterium]|nr:MAG: hypothetical protein DCC58_11265 [Chloroflexota bacterium]